MSLGYIQTFSFKKKKNHKLAVYIRRFMYYGYNEGAQQMLARYEKQVRSCQENFAKKVIL